MTAARIFLASVLAILLSTPAQAEDEQFRSVYAQCREDWIILKKVIYCVAERWEPHLEARQHERWKDPKLRHLEIIGIVLEKVLKFRQQQNLLDGPSLRCAGDGRVGPGMLSCSTEPLNIADAPPVQPK